MAIPKEITNAVELALQNNTLSKRRDLIADMAMSMGVGMGEIYQYIRDAEDRDMHSEDYLINDDPTLVTPPPYNPTNIEESDGYSIPQKVINLTALALKDRVLTFKERRTIVQTAIEMGVFEERINEYLDNALEERLKSYSKEDLQHCPHCGAQTPLVSDNCLFCGKSLKVGDLTDEPMDILGEEAQIIEEENLKTDIKRHNIKQCPDCGAPFPLISNVCPSCGHTLHEQADSALNVNKLIEGINNSYTKLKNTPTPTFVALLKHYFGLIAFLLFLATGAIPEDFLPQDSIVGRYKTAFFFCLTVIGFILWKVSDFKDADNVYHKAKNDFQMYLRMVNTFYGNHLEAKALIGHFSEALNLYEQNYKDNQKKLARFALIALIVLLLPFVFAKTLH